MDRTITAALSIGTAIIGVAIIAVLVSNNAKTVDVIKAMFDGFNSALKTAVSPISK